MVVVVVVVVVVGPDLRGPNLGNVRGPSSSSRRRRRSSSSSGSSGGGSGSGSGSSGCCWRQFGARTWETSGARAVVVEEE